MPADLMTHKFESGFTLVELLVGVAIISIGASSAIPSLYKQFQQSSIDSYTQKLESGLNQIKANMISRQSSCVIRFPLQATQEPGVAPSQLDNLIVNEEAKVDEEAECPQPGNMKDGWTMASTKMRMVAIKNTQTKSEDQNIRIMIHPEAIAFNTVGGVARPSLAFSNEPLVIRIRSLALGDSGLERCLYMHPTTGEITSGTWNGGDFTTGKCSTSI